MKVGDLVRFRNCFETGFIIQVLNEYVVVLWSSVWNRTFEEQSQLEVISEGG